MPINHVDDRLALYNNINDFINDYIRKKENNNEESRCLTKDNKLNFKGQIFLDKKIGVLSLSGNIYISHITHENTDYQFITKLQLNGEGLESDAENELKILELIKNYLLQDNFTNKTFNIHLPILYNNLECIHYNINQNIITIKDDETKSINLDDISYYSTFVEKADGSLEDFVENKNFTDTELLNVIMQCMISTYSLHKLKVIHNDLHTGNFLFYEIAKKDNQYFEYIVNLNDKSTFVFYLKNVGYNFLIWDFGKSQIIKKKDKHLLKFLNNDYLTFFLSLYSILLKQNKKTKYYQLIYFIGAYLLTFERLNKNKNIFYLLYHIFEKDYNSKTILLELPEGAEILKTIYI